MNAAPWYAPPVARPGHCIVIGGGLAGCSVAHALDQLGLPVTLVEQQVVGSGASGNQRAVLRPHLNRTSGIHNRFSQTAFLAAVSVLQQLANTGCKPEYELCGVLQLLDNIDNWPAFDCAVPLDASAMQKFSHGLFPCNINREPGTRKGALHSESAGWVNIASYCQALLSNASNLQIYEHHAAEQITPTAQRWQVAVNHRGIRSTLEADNVIVTSGPGTQPLLAGHDLPLTISAGQTTRYSSPVFTGGTIITGSRYLIPEDGICTLGATHHRGSNQLQATDEDDAANVSAVREMLPRLTTLGTIVDHWRALRASTPDRLPLAGAMPNLSHYQHHYAALRHGSKHQAWATASYVPGLYLLAGLGSRGLLNSRLCATLVAASITGTLTGEHRQFAELVHPARFIVRSLQRQRF